MFIVLIMQKKYVWYHVSNNIYSNMKKIEFCIFWQKILYLICVCYFFLYVVKLLLFLTITVLLSFLISLMRAPRPTHSHGHTHIFFFLCFPHLLPISLFASKAYFAKVIKLHPNHSTKTDYPYLCRTLSFFYFAKVYCLFFFFPHLSCGKKEGNKRKTN